MKTRKNALQTLLRTLDALERELLDASDADVLAAAADLRLKPEMQGSIALLGVTKRVRLVPRQSGRAIAKAARGGRTVPVRPPKE